MLSAGELSAAPSGDQCHPSALRLVVQSPLRTDSLRRPASLAAPAAVGIGRMESHQRRADGKATSKPTDRLNLGLPGRCWIVSSQLPGSRQALPCWGRQVVHCWDPALFRPEVPGRWAPGFRSPPPPPARPAAPSPAELLTSFFTSVKSSSVRDRAGASMAEAGKASFRPAPPRPG